MGGKQVFVFAASVVVCLAAGFLIGYMAGTNALPGMRLTGSDVPSRYMSTSGTAGDMEDIMELLALLQSIGSDMRASENQVREREHKERMNQVQALVEQLRNASRQKAVSAAKSGQTSLSAQGIGSSMNAGVAGQTLGKSQASSIGNREHNSDEAREAAAEAARLERERMQSYIDQQKEAIEAVRQALQRILEAEQEAQRAAVRI